MKMIVVPALILFTAAFCFAEDDIIIEAAAGIPNDDGYEFALKGSYRLNSFLDLSLTGGVVQDIQISGNDRICYIPPIGGYDENDEKNYRAYYAVPVLKIKSKIIRADLGGFLYYEDPDSYRYGCPFTRDNHIQPAFGIELGEPNFYFFGRSLVSMPLYSSGGPFELGIGGRTAAGYEHKVFYFLLEGRSGPYTSIGYRGEIRILKSNAIVFGASFFSIIVGVKFAL